MGACVTNCQTFHRANMKKQQRSHSEEMRLYWLFCPTSKGYQRHIVEDCDFTILLQLQRAGSKRISHWHIIDCVIFLFQTKKKKQSKWGKSDGEQGNNGSPWFTPFWYPWQLVLVYYKDGIHTEEDMMRKQNPSSGKLLLSRSRKSGSHTWVGFGVFLSRDIITRDTGI